MSTPRPSNGRIVWHDLMSTDPKASLAFFTELVGWRTQEVDMGPMGKYTMFFVGEKDVGGLMPLETSHGVPSHFVAYVHVDDINAALERAQRLGGKVAVPPTPIPDVGTFAVLIDPLGGVTSPMTLTNPKPEDNAIPKQGMFCWEELMSADPEASATFYSEVYGYSVEAMDMGPVGTYRILKRGDAMDGGIMKSPPEMSGATHWMTYIAVDDVDAMSARAEKLGGKVLNPPMDVPNIGRMAVIQDPAGTVFSLFKGASELAPEAKAG